MKTKFFLGLAAAAMLLASCSQDEAIESGATDANVIRLGVNISTNSRALASYCPHYLPPQFLLTAIHNGEANTGIYFRDVQMNVSLFNNSASFADGSLRYWPDNALDFYAWYTDQEGPVADFAHTESQTDAETGQTTEVADPIITGFTVNPDVTLQEDFLYAEKPGAEKSNSAVQIEFKHALAQLVFSAVCENEAINVNIKEVGVTGIYGTGVFHFNERVLAQAESTIRDTDDSEGSGMRVQHNIDAIHASEGKYRWTPVEDTSTTEYMIAMPEGGVDISAANVDENGNPAITVLTSAPAESTHEALTYSGQWSNAWANVLQLIPQSGHSLMMQYNNSNILTTASRAIGGNNEKLSSGYHINRAGDDGIYSSVAYIKICCDITAPNVVLDPTQDPTFNTLYASTDALGQKQYLYIPFIFDWKEGYRYVYTLRFSKEGNGGTVTPGGDDVLNHIGITVNVSEYSDETNTNPVEYSVYQGIASSVPHLLE